MSATSNNELSADEIALYDRQLRVWGAEGQTHIKSTRLLLLNFNSLAAEILKNLVLAGIGAVEVFDTNKVTEHDLGGGNFFLSEADKGGERVATSVVDRVKDLNPRVNVTSRSQELDWQDLDYFKQFTLIIANNLSYEDSLRLNEITRELSIPLYLTFNHGLFGLAYNDLLVNVSTYVDYKNPLARTVGAISRNSEITKVEKFYDEESEKFKERFVVKSHYKQFKDVYETSAFKGLTKRKRKNVSDLLGLFLTSIRDPSLQVKAEASLISAAANSLQSQLHLNPIASTATVEQFLSQQGSELSPVCAIMGGALSQDVINFISKKSEPMNGVLVFDGVNYAMPVYEI